MGIIALLGNWQQPADTGIAVPHAYKADGRLQTVRHPSGNNKPVINYELSRDYAATWKAMEALVESGKAKSIGIICVSIMDRLGG